MSVDALVENHGSIFLVKPLTLRCENWLKDHVSNEAQYFGGKLVVEHRYILPLVQGMTDDGMEVK